MSSLALFTPSFLLTRMPWPSKKLGATADSPRDVSRVWVRVTVRSNTSTSPDCSAVKRCWVDSAVPLNLVGSPNTAAATARQMSTSMPSHSPLLLVAENPETPSVRPHCTNPFFFTASRVGPASAAWDAHARAKAPAANHVDRFIVLLLRVKFEPDYAMSTP
ncbi:hypothetical protein D3C72_1796690 [compost metagenome]